MKQRALPLLGSSLWAIPAAAQTAAQAVEPTLTGQSYRIEQRPHSTNFALKIGNSPNAWGQNDVITVVR